MYRFHVIMVIIPFLFILTGCNAIIGSVANYNENGTFQSPGKPSAYEKALCYEASKRCSPIKRFRKQPSLAYAYFLVAHKMGDIRAVQELRRMEAEYDISIIEQGKQDSTRWLENFKWPLTAKLRYLKST